MSAIEFQPFPKLARLNRNITITEKLDGTNAAVVIVQEDATDRGFANGPDVNRVAFIRTSVDTFSVYAQSRNRFITPRDDNYGFAGWVARNAEALVDILGAGTHFGEWWGSGIQRVPVLYEGPFGQLEIDLAIANLDLDGSEAAEGFEHPEGIVIYHQAARQSFKVTLEGDAAPKAQPRRNHDLLPERSAA